MSILISWARLFALTVGTVAELRTDALFLSKTQHVILSQQSTSALKKTSDPYVIAKLAAQELDRCYPMMELPKLSCFAGSLNEEPPDPEEILQQVAAEQREKERLLFVKRLRRMYHLSQSNQASTKRIMDQRPDDFMNEGPGLEELVLSFVNCSSLLLITAASKMFSHPAAGIAGAHIP